MSIPDNIEIIKNPNEKSYWEDIYELVTKTEKWFNTPNDYDIWRNGFGDDFTLYVAIDKNANKAIGSASAINYKTLNNEELITCNGMVCVNPNYRGQNIGLTLSKLVMNNDVGYKNKSLIAVPKMSKKYSEIFGFNIIPEDNMTDIEFNVEEIDLNKKIDINDNITIKFPNNDNDWDLIYQFDRKILKNTQRDKFLKLFCSQENSYFKVALNNDTSKIEGVCLIRLNLQMKILYTGPFYATSLEIAESLFLETLKSIPNLLSFKKIRLAFYRSSKTPNLVKDLVKTSAITEAKHFLQFTEKSLDLPGELVYSVTENDVSFI